MLIESRSLRWLLIAAMTLGFFGLPACGGDEAEATAGESSNPTGDAGTAESTPSDEGSGSAKRPEPGAPDALMHAAARSVEESDPTIVWNALPASYRTDIEGLVHAFAGKMDPAVWDKAMGLMGKLGKTLGEKGGFLAANPMLAGMIQNSGMTSDQLKAQLDSAASGLEAITGGQLASLESLKTIEMETLLKTDVSKAMKNVQGGVMEWLSGQVEGEEGPTLQEQLAKMKTTVLEQDGDRAKVRVETVGEEPEETEMMRVEGVWVPAEVGEEWATNMAEARKTIDGMEMDAATKGQAMMKEANQQQAWLRAG